MGEPGGAVGIGAGVGEGDDAVLGEGDDALVGEGDDALVGEGDDAVVGEGDDALVGEGDDALVGEGDDALVGEGDDALVGEGDDALVGEGDDALVAELRARVRGAVLAGEPLAHHTTLKVGGPATALVRAEAPADLVAVAEVCARTRRPWLIVGRGSNLLVADRGWPGVAVTLGQGFRGLRVDGENVEAGAAEPMPVLAQQVARHGLGGLAFGVAIPGSLGGAVRMNAGAHGGQIRDLLESAEVVRLARGGAVERISVEDLRMGYRHSDLPSDAVVVRARLRLRRADPARLAAEMAEMRAWRRANQPINEPSCGSVFRNPEGDSAGRLVEAAGMKGFRVGGARVSPVHANFITVNRAARADDVYAVIAAVRMAVAERFEVRLRTEVVLAGFPDEPDAREGAFA